MKPMKLMICHKEGLKVSFTGFIQTKEDIKKEIVIVLKGVDDTDKKVNALSLDFEDRFVIIPCKYLQNSIIEIIDEPLP
jgi:hypothetical protein